MLHHKLFHPIVNFYLLTCLSLEYTVPTYLTVCMSNLCIVKVSRAIYPTAKIL